MNQKKRLELQLKTALPPIIEQIKNGDSSRKEELAVLLLPYVRLLSRKYQKVIGDDINSLSGWIVTRIISKINNIDLNKSVLGYIARSTINYCIDMCRKYTKSVEKNAKAFDQLTYDEYYSKLQSNYIEDLGSLKFYIEQTFVPSDAKIVDMFYLQNKSLSEISMVTGQSEEIIQETVTLAREYICR